MKKKYAIGIVGNPNSGKTTVFNALTGGKQRVGNWPGVTVERKIGRYVFNAKEIQVIDLPGIYSLSTASLDEQVAREYILQEKPDLIVNVVDASNIERNLYLTAQLIEMRVPFIIVLNMMDIVKQRNLKIKIDGLMQLLDVPVTATVANRKGSVRVVEEVIDRYLVEPPISAANIYYQDEVEKAIATLCENVPTSEDVADIVRQDERWAAIQLLEEDAYLQEIEKTPEEKQVIGALKDSIQKILGEDVDILIAEGRYGFIHSVCKKVVDASNIIRKNVTDAIDKIVLNRIVGIPLFFICMFLTFWVTINIGGCFIDFFDILLGTLCVDGIGALMQFYGMPLLMQSIVAEGVGGSMQTVATFIPPIFFMFLCLSFLEDSGYMARAAFLMDRLMRCIGLPGKAFVPLLIGFGCNVPAIMASRTLENRKDRILSIMMNPLMSCGARLPVYALFAAAFFPQHGGLVVFVLYLIGVAMAIGTAYLLKSTILTGEPSPFIMELPPYHIPTVRALFLHTWERLQSFIVRAGKAILVVVVLMSLLSFLGTDGSGNHAQREHSVLSTTGKMIVPLFKPLGIDEDNWPAAVGLFAGVFAKEAVIGSLDALYTQLDSGQEDHSSAKEYADSFVVTGIVDACVSIPRNFMQLLFGAQQENAEEVAASHRMRDAMQRRFDGKAGAFAYLLFVLLYMPCIAAIAAVYNELNVRWTLFSVVYLSGLAWMSATIFYQVARFSRHPMQSVSWVLCCVALFFSGIGILKRIGCRDKHV